MTSIQQGVGCSPIKPSFKSNQEVLNAAADWLEATGSNGYDEYSFHTLENVADKMNDGPLKTFTKILGIAGAAAFTGKQGLQTLYTKLSNNTQAREYLMKPVIRLVDTGMNKLTKFIKESPEIGNKSFKGFIMTNAKKGMDAFNEFAQKGSETAKETLRADIKNLKNEIIDTIKAAAAKEGKTLNDKALVAAYRKELKGTSEQVMKYKKLVEENKLADADNLVKKVSGNIAGISAGTTAAIAANRDKDGDGIADIGQHSAA